jgi:hypothetical protein
MFALGLLELALFGGVGVLLFYAVVRLAVKHGTIDAHRQLESDRVRERDNLGPERSPNSRQ